MAPDAPVDEVPIRDAATVMVVRDGRRGLEVLLLRRTSRAVFVPGAHVYPGGAVDPADGPPELDDPVTGDGLRFRTAAVREAFEEAGLLLADGTDGSPVRFGAGPRAERFRRYRHEVYRGALPLDRLAATEGLALWTERLHYVSRWVTPVGGPRRFDTRFFLTAAPGDQEPLHDDEEIVASTWMRPGDALRAAAHGELLLIEPTEANLRIVADFDQVDGLMRVAGAGGLYQEGPNDG